MAYNSTIDKATDDILVYANTAKDASGTSYVPLVDADGHLQVDALTTALPTGASTAANQTTIIGHLDGVESLLTTIDADTGAISTASTAIQTAVQLIDDTVAVLGTDTFTEAASKGLVIGAVRRDADTTLVNTTNEISPLQVDANGRLKVEAFSGETLPVSLTSTTVTGTVAVTQSGTWDEVGINDSGNSITVDAPVGTPVFVRLSDGASAITTLPVSLASVPSHAVTNAGTFAVQVDGNALTALQLIDDVVVADNAGFTDGTTKLSMGGFIYDEVAGTALTENDAAAARINVNRAQIGIIEDGVTRGRYATVSASNALKVDGSAVTQPVSGSVTATLAAGTNTNEVVGDAAHDAVVSGNPVLIGGSASAAAPASVSADGDAVRAWYLRNGAQATVVTAAGALIGGDATNGLDVDVTRIIPGTGATNLGKAEDAAHASGDTGVMALGVANEGNTAFGANGDYVPMACDTEGNRRIVGNRDHDAVDAGEVVKVGGMARTTNPTAVADADRAHFITDDLGKQVVVGSIRDLKVAQHTTITSSVTETTVLTAGAAGVFHDVYGVIVTNTSATGLHVIFKDSTAGTERFRIYVPANDTRGFMLNESAGHNQATAANNWTATCGASVASVYITMMAVKNI